MHSGFLSLILPDAKRSKKNCSWIGGFCISNYGFLIRNLNLMLILADLIFKQNEAMWLAELNISAIYDQLMKLNFLSLLFLRPINSHPNIFTNNCCQNLNWAGSISHVDTFLIFSVTIWKQCDWLKAHVRPNEKFRFCVLLEFHKPTSKLTQIQQ